MKAGIYCPYWDTLGGGENYLATIAQILAKLDYKVSIFWHDQALGGQITQRFGLELSNIEINELGYEVIGKGSLAAKGKLMREFDLMIWLSDGSLPFLFAKKNLVHFQVPFHGVKGRSLVNRIKLLTIDYCFCNSRFTKKVIDQEFGINSAMIYPPIRKIPGLTKEPIILSVGRFDSHLNSKRQDVLVEAMKKGNFKGWKLIIAGGLLNDDKNLGDLKQRAGHSEVEFVTNPSFEELSSFYGKASLYWHAAGYGQDLKTYPEKAEHFGMSAAEAMSAGAVPLVFNGGGLPEVIGKSGGGLLWENTDELVSKTQSLIENNKLRTEMSQKAINRADKFSEEVFTHEFQKLIL